MNARDYAKEYIRIVEDRVEPESRTSKWDEESKWVEETITKLVQSAIEEDRKTRECCKAEREACAMIADEMKAELSQRPEKLQYGRTQIEVAEYIGTEIRARSDS